MIIGPKPDAMDRQQCSIIISESNRRTPLPALYTNAEAVGVATFLCHLPLQGYS